MHFASGMSVPFFALKLQGLLGNALDMFTLFTINYQAHVHNLL